MSLMRGIHRSDSLIGFLYPTLLTQLKHISYFHQHLFYIFCKDNKNVYRECGNLRKKEEPDHKKVGQNKCPARLG
jgi:hypothetical protein